MYCKTIILYSRKNKKELIFEVNIDEIDRLKYRCRNTKLLK